MPFSSTCKMKEINKEVIDALYRKYLQAGGPMTMSGMFELVSDGRRNSPVPSTCTLTESLYYYLDCQVFLLEHTLEELCAIADADREEREALMPPRIQEIVKNMRGDLEHFDKETKRMLELDSES
jgi:hypothetical protein